MAIIKTLKYQDEDVAPRTKVKAISDDDGNSLETILSDIENKTSHVGQVILTTTLDTLAKMRAVYGSSTNWTLLTDYFLVGAGNRYSAEETGGEATHTLTVDEMPKHYHNLIEEYGADANGNYPPEAGQYSQLAGPNAGTRTKTGQSIEYTGGSQPHNNLPPYYGVYMWIRTA